MPLRAKWNCWNSYRGITQQQAIVKYIELFSAACPEFKDKNIDKDADKPSQGGAAQSASQSASAASASSAAAVTSTSGGSGGIAAQSSSNDVSKSSLEPPPSPRKKIDLAERIYFAHETIEAIND